MLEEMFHEVAEEEVEGRWALLMWPAAVRQAAATAAAAVREQQHALSVEP